MREDIFKASLNNDSSSITQIYDINRFFYVAFFGGIIPTIVLGTKNLRWLKINKKLSNLFIAIGIIILLSKVTVACLILGKFLVFNRRYLSRSYKIATVILYLGYYAVMKQKFKQHLFLGGQIKPLLKDSIQWIIIGIIIEAFLILVGGPIINVIFR